MEQYAAAGGLATESLGAFRTITALNAQPFILNKYRTYLIEAMRVRWHLDDNLQIIMPLYYCR